MHPSVLSRRAVAFGVAACTVAGAAFAADPAASSAGSRYQKERAVCDAGLSQQDRATCLKEAGAAKVEAQRGQLPGGTATALGANATDRCNALPEKDRADCLARIQGPAAPNQRTSTSGSVGGGGLLRETTTTTTTIVPASAPGGARPASVPR